MKINKRLEAQLMVAGIKSDMAKTFGVDRIPTFEMLASPNPQELKWLNQDRLSEIRVGPTISCRGVPCVLVEFDQSNGEYDILLLTKDFGFQVLPRSLKEAFKTDRQEDLESFASGLLIMFGSILDSEKMTTWFRGCCEMNGFAVPAYALEGK